MVQLFEICFYRVRVRVRVAIILEWEIGDWLPKHIFPQVFCGSHGLNYLQFLLYFRQIFSSLGLLLAKEVCFLGVSFEFFSGLNQTPPKERKNRG